MPKFRVLKVLSFLSIYALFVAPSIAQENQEQERDNLEQSEARQAGELWFSRMQEALLTLNFSAKLVVVDSFGMQMYRWLHSVDENELEIEVLEQLDGPPQPIIRVDNRLSYFQSVGESYSTEGEHIVGPWPEGIYESVERLLESYDIYLAGGARILDTQAIHVRMIPTSSDRYSYSFYMDRNTGMLLGAKTFAPEGQLLNQVLLSHFEYQHGPIQELESSVNELQFPEIRSTGSVTETTSQWSVSELPIGFQLIRQQVVALQPFTSSADHLLFSDGMTQFSVYINHGRERPAPVSVQSLYSVVSVDKGAYAVTVVGKIPIPLAEVIAQSVQHKETR